MHSTRWITASIWLAIAAPAWAQESGSGPARTPNTLAATGVAPAARIADLGWLVGHWRGQGLGGVSEEIWAPPEGGVMMGMYRLVLGGAPSFYEFMHLAEANGSLVLKLKHFNADLTAWEDKERFVTFPLVKIAPTEAFFGGLTFRRVSPDRLQIFLALRDKSGTVREEAFDFTRVKP